jgi:hypothetical protein
MDATMHDVRSRPSPRRIALLASVLVLLLCVGVVLAPRPARAVSTADNLVVRSVHVSNSKIRADGGQTTVTVTVSGVSSDESDVTLTATLGSFGAPSGPSRIVLTLRVSLTGGNRTASAELYGDGRSGTAVVTAQVSESTRSVAVVMTGGPATIEFEMPDPNAILPADAPALISIQVRDADGVSVPQAEVEFTASKGVVSSGNDIGGVVMTDRNGRARSVLNAAPGIVRLTAVTGSTTAVLTLTLHGPPVSLQVIAIRDVLIAGEAPSGTFIAILLDDGGRPVPRSPITFTSDREDVRVVHSAEGESNVTDASGRAMGHLTMSADAAPGAVVISVATDGLGDAADGLQDEESVQILGPPALITLSYEPLSQGVYQVTAAVQDLAGFDIPAGFTVHWSASGLEADLASVLLDPEATAVSDGMAVTIISLDQPTIEPVRISGRVTPEGVVDQELIDALANAPANGVALPIQPAFGGVPLSAGLNVLRWLGEPSTIADAIAPIAPLVSAVWQFSEVTGWLGYFPAIGIGQNIDLDPSAPFFLFLTANAALPGIEVLLAASP